MGLDNFQETRPESLFQDCSKYVFQANTPKQAINGLQTAIQHAISKKGVAVLALPGDVAAAGLEYVAYLVDKLADDDAIFTVDTGMSAVWAARYLKAGRNRYLTGSFL